MKSGASRGHLVLMGAGHAHFLVLMRLHEFIQRGISVTVISPAPFWYSGMGPGLLAGQYQKEEVTADVRTLVECLGGTFIEEKVTDIQPEKQILLTEGGNTVAYDILSLNIGSEVPGAKEYQEVPFLYTVKPISEFEKMQKAILRAAEKKKVQVQIIGGGPAACETAAAIHELCMRRNLSAEISLLTNQDRLLTNMTEKAGIYMHEWCSRHDIDVRMNLEFAGMDGHNLLLGKGERLKADIIILATGVRPPGLLSKTDLATETNGALKVNACLQSISHSNVFGGGDCIAFEGHPLPRIGVYAVRQSPVLFENLLASFQKAPLRHFIPQKTYVLILRMGYHKGLFVQHRRVFTGYLAYLFKSYLDRKFIKKLQKSVRKRQNA